MCSMQSWFAMLLLRIFLRRIPTRCDRLLFWCVVPRNWNGVFVHMRISRDAREMLCVALEAKLSYFFANQCGKFQSCFVVKKTLTLLTPTTSLFLRLRHQYRRREFHGSSQINCFIMDENCDESNQRMEGLSIKDEMSKEGNSFRCHKTDAFPCISSGTILPDHPSRWPQRPLMIRPTPMSSTKVIGFVSDNAFYCTLHR